jgi:hypothetical protein
MDLRLRGVIGGVSGWQDRADLTVSVRPRRVALVVVEDP